MKSGLEGRNNPQDPRHPRGHHHVSMKSGLEGRNNWDVALLNVLIMHCLNEVRPRRPEQSGTTTGRSTAETMSQ